MRRSRSTRVGCSQYCRIRPRRQEHERWLASSWPGSSWATNQSKSSTSSRFRHTELVEYQPPARINLGGPRLAQRSWKVSIPLPPSSSPTVARNRVAQHDNTFETRPPGFDHGLVTRRFPFGSSMGFLVIRRAGTDTPSQRIPDFRSQMPSGCS